MLQKLKNPCRHILRLRDLATSHKPVIIVHYLGFCDITGQLHHFRDLFFSRWEQSTTEVPALPLPTKPKGRLPSKSASPAGPSFSH